MAKLSAHEIVLRFEHRSGRTLYAVSKTGIILKRDRVFRSGWRSYGKVKPGLTVGDFVGIMLKDGYRVTQDSMQYTHVFRTEARARSEGKAKDKRAADRAAVQAEQERQEAVVLNRPLDAVGMAILETHVAIFARNDVRCIDHTLEYLRQLARFAGGATGGRIHGLMGVRFLFDSTDHALLEPIADAAARIAFGSDMRGAARWHRAMYGY